MKRTQYTTVVTNPTPANVHGHPGNNPVVHNPIPPFQPGYMPGYNPYAFYAFNQHQHPNPHGHHQHPNVHGHGPTHSHP
jgi:hypothetical protein